MGWLTDFLGDGIPKVIRRTLAECIIGNTNASSINTSAPFKLPNNDLLQQELIQCYAIECFDASMMAVGPSGNPVIPVASDGYFVLQLADGSGGGNTFRDFQSPLFDYFASYNSGYARQFDPFSIQLTNSYAVLTGAAQATLQALLPSPPYSLPISIWYFGQADAIEYLKSCGAASSDIEKAINGLYPQLGGRFKLAA
jgi:hypothetical protein